MHARPLLPWDEAPCGGAIRRRVVHDRANGAYSGRVFALVYVSEAARSFDDAELEELAVRSAVKNERLRITGYLHYAPERHTFFQYLEGAREAVLGLMAEIAEDERHRIRNMLELGEIGQRHFPGWSMRLVRDGELRAIRLDDVLESVLLTMCEPAFSPDETRPAALRIVRRLAARELR